MIKVGTLFAGRYGVIQKIGTGGMAEVFKAQDVVENRGDVLGLGHYADLGLIVALSRAAARQSGCADDDSCQQGGKNAVKNVFFFGLFLGGHEKHFL